jgi:integrase
VMAEWLSRQQRSEFVLSYPDVKKIVYSAVSFRDRVLLKALYYQGLRRMEVCNLEVADIDFVRRRLTVRGKFKVLRVIPILDSDFLSDLEHLVKGRAFGPVFVHSRRALSPRQINNIVARASVLAGVKSPIPNSLRVNPHIFRHSIARHLKDKGFSVEFVQKFLGHASFKTTMDCYGTMSLDSMESMARAKGILDFKDSKVLLE